MGTGNGGLRVLIFPWLAYGHIAPALELAKELSDRGFKPHICSTAINLSFIRKKITGKYSFSIQLVEIHLPDLAELPPHYHTTNGLPPHLMSTLKKALKMAKTHLESILTSLAPDLLIYDVMQPWSASVASKQNIPAAQFITSSAAMCSYFSHEMMKSGTEFPFPEIHLYGYEKDYIRSLLKNAVTERKDEQEDPEDEAIERGLTSITLMKTSRILEGKYLDYLADMSKMKIVPVGPLIEEHVITDNQDTNDLIEWLGKKSESSSVYVSFGSEYFLKKEELGEIALGLELSNVNFIWVVRFPAGETVKIEEALPEGFLERVENRGRIVEGWAPQVKILSHPSIGGFICHCGWNSIVESIQFAVPIIAMPMHLDQPMNARLAVDLGIAVEAMRDEQGKLQRDEIARVIRDVVVGKTGQNLKNKAREIHKNVSLKGQEEMDEAAEVLVNLCKNRKNSSVLHHHPEAAN